jgi:hypothetical protein
MRIHAPLVAVVCLWMGCAATVVPLDTAVPVTDTTPRAVPLEVVTRAIGVPEPLPLAGAAARYRDLELSLGHAVSTAVVPWADAHRDERAGGWQLLVELTGARARRQEGQVEVTLTARATLRGRVGHVYLGQTQAHCHARAPAAATAAAPIFYGCMMSLGRELAGWLGGIQP